MRVGIILMFGMDRAQCPPDGVTGGHWGACKTDPFSIVYGPKVRRLIANQVYSPGFRKKYQAFLVRGLPNIPMAPDFRAFERAGRELAKLHLNFEAGPRHDLGEPPHKIPDAPRKIKFGKKSREGPGPKTTDDHSALIIDGVTVYRHIPDIHYKVNDRTPVGWFVDRYAYKQDKTTGITNYPLEKKSGEEVRAIIERLVYVGVESDRIIAGLPKEFEMNTAPDTPSKSGWAVTQQLVFGADGLESNPSSLDKYTKAAV